MTDKISKTFCVLPWMHMHIGTSGDVLPCCVGSFYKPLANARKDTISNIWNSDEYKSMRLKMLAGEQCSQCSSCYRNEEVGVQSYRQSANKEYKQHIQLSKNTQPDGSIELANLKYLDIRWSNICNFKCRTCNNAFSSSWASENNKYGNDNTVYMFAGGEDNDTLYEQIKPVLSTIEEIYFVGGEPLLTDKHYDILEELIRIGRVNVKLRYSTNLSTLVYKGKHITDYWNKFSQVLVFASLDSWGERAEYIRDGTDWNKIVENIKIIKTKSPKVNLEMSSVVSVLNVKTLPEFLEYLKQNDLFRNKINFYNLLTPEKYSFDVLPDQERLNIIEKLKNIPIADSVVNHLKNSSYDEFLHEKFLKETKIYDERRNQNFNDVFPELRFLNREFQ